MKRSLVLKVVPSVLVLHHQVKALNKRSTKGTKRDFQQFFVVCTASHSNLSIKPLLESESKGFRSHHMIVIQQPLSQYLLLRSFQNEFVL